MLFYVGFHNIKVFSLAILDIFLHFWKFCPIYNISVQRLGHWFMRPKNPSIYKSREAINLLRRLMGPLISDADKINKAIYLKVQRGHSFMSHRRHWYKTKERYVILFLFSWYQSFFTCHFGNNFSCLKILSNL